ncbi:aminotransferase class I/II-fold pyridoxal phosphate-dependent enzyme [Reichenbachiella carrageenanivorans]|uniref:Aminotransferase class I/II-fold pyridoxal phosphate-dependent enzyme n=1 Tax=Reichenbachiella carrageenanivorans TaxID=2979869 RepID=A0ABY6D2R0_9BACT|nr:aminotransferase class I/II-fold pyridoxal phosphate-dependent enzyme [Reichenbachiella carrageenanivorans]UXX79348.1 aminotransferase class I/II-fold pyridoxal phosphate-dependent enzyme [Reichenbachiella carrageenanivorans]
MINERIYLSPPYQSGHELEAFRQVLDSNWLAPVGPGLERFEAEICKATGFKYAVATSSGTAAIHLGMKVLGVESGDAVLASTMTFVGGVSPIRYCGAMPVYIDSDYTTWNINVDQVEQYLDLQPTNVKAILPTHLYGMPADVKRIETLGKQYQVPILHDLAECLAGKVDGKTLGALVERGVYSFNGNKLITTSGGGAFVTNHKEEAEQALYLATQAKSPVLEYHHEAIGYNYRMSNVLAALGVAQISTLADRVARKQRIFDTYQQALAPLGFGFQEGQVGAESDRWLTCVLFNPDLMIDISVIVSQMNEWNIEVRPLWKPMHRQPVFENEKVIGGAVSSALYRCGLCLPSGCGLTDEQQARVIHRLRAILGL